MAYKSIDEIDRFRFDDCRIHEFRVEPHGLSLEVEALIVRANNSQNTNYTESYADVTEISVKGGRIEKIIKDGYRYYDADDVLLSEVPDQILQETEQKAFPATCEGAYLYEITRLPEGYRLGIEFEDPEDHTASDSYQVLVNGESIVCTWERYMNRVQA